MSEVTNKKGRPGPRPFVYARLTISFGRKIKLDTLLGKIFDPAETHQRHL